METKKIENPFRPGAGHMPPYLAGRAHERQEFEKILAQNPILINPILTGLRGLGKTVLLDTFKPMAIQTGWLWAGTDLSESTSISEESLATRLLADLSVVTSQIVARVIDQPIPGFGAKTELHEVKFDYAYLRYIYDQTPGLTIDKLKAVLEMIWPELRKLGKRGLIFAYDEAQNLADHAAKEQFPLSLLLDLFQSIQKKNIPFMLALTGLPMLFPKLVEARTFSERMFHQIILGPLTIEETRDAVRKPIDEAKTKGVCPINFTDPSLDTIWKITKGYPYFIQFVCRECFDVWMQSIDDGKAPVSIPVDAIERKLDTDFFAGRWGKATDRQRDLLLIVAQLPNADQEFTVQEIVDSSTNASYEKPFSSSNTSQVLGALTEVGLVYKNRHGKYVLAVPLFSGFIKRMMTPTVQG